MSDKNPLTSITKSRSDLARLHRGEPNPDPELKRLYKANLATANLDKKIREQVRGVELGPAHVAHLVGLILMESGVAGANVALIEKLARDAVETGHDGDAR